MKWQTIFSELPLVLRPLVDEYPWSILIALDDFLQTISCNSDLYLEERKQKAESLNVNITGQVYIAKSAVVEDGATIIGPAYIGENAIIRQGAYIRGGAYIGDGVVVGHATEVKRAVFLEHSHAPHFNYVGDSVLGKNVNLGAGVKVSNLKNDSSEVKIGDISTKMKKVGAFIGDNTKIGCNAVTAPGTIIGKNCLVYPLVFIRGVIPENSIVKLRQETLVINKD